MEINKNSLDKDIYIASAGEGLGSLYERVEVRKLFSNLAKTCKFSTVLEFTGLLITKGFDNITFLSLGKNTTLFDKNIKYFRYNWPFNIKPLFIQTLKENQKFDLVWNFAVVQNSPDILEQMIKISRKYILIIVPNFLNWGTPIHLFYHFITDSKCSHAERGSISLRTIWGIKKYVQSKELKIVKSGFIDIPLLPDIGFSINELKERLGKKTKNLNKENPINPKLIRQRLFNLGFLERMRIPEMLKLPFAHHIYVLARVK